MSESKPVTPSYFLAGAHLRVARPTNDLAALRRFYCDGLGLSVLFEFANKGGYDGVMLGGPGQPYHFEFTREIGHDAGRAPSQENLLVFYLPDPAYEFEPARMLLFMRLIMRFIMTNYIGSSIRTIGTMVRGQLTLSPT